MSQDHNKGRVMSVVNYMKVPLTFFPEHVRELKGLEFMSLSSQEKTTGHFEQRYFVRLDRQLNPTSLFKEQD